MDKLLFLLYLIWISYQDFREMQVVRYSHLLGLAAIVWAIVIHGDSGVFSWELLMVYLLQIIGFALKWYGLADAIVMCICATFYCAIVGSTRCFLFCFAMQAMAGILLILVQILKNNINGLKLKKPIPYIPYISIAFFLTKWVI